MKTIKAGFGQALFMGGLFQFDENLQSFKKFAKNNYISGIQQDNYNNLWIYSASGISLLDPGKNQVRNLPEIPGIPYHALYSKQAAGFFYLV